MSGSVESAEREALTSEELAAFARQLHGHEHGAVRALSDRLGIQYDTLRKAVSGARRLGPYHTRLVRELMAQTPQPPEPVDAAVPRAPSTDGPGRNGRCRKALAPALAAVLHAAETAGWQRSEALEQVLGWAAVRLADSGSQEHAQRALRRAAGEVQLLAPLDALHRQKSPPQQS